MSRMSTANAFFFVAMRPGGGRKLGVRQASHPGALAETLRAERLLLLKYYRLPAWAASDSSNLKLKDQLTINDTMAQLISRGVPLVEALDVIAATVRPRIRNTVGQMRDRVAGGSSLADACRDTGSFDAVTISIFEAAERSGDLAGASEELARAARRRLEISGQAITLMLYPVIVTTIAIVVSALLMIFVVPKIGESLSDAGMPLPKVSQILVEIGTWMHSNLMTVGLVVLAFLVALLIGHRLVGALANRVMRTAPVLRDVVIAQESARFFSVMAAMTRSGVPIAEALTVANQAVAHPALFAQLQKLRQKLVEGGLLRNLIEDVSAFPVATRRLLVAAERSGDLEHAFAALAQDLTDEVERKSTRALAILEPLLIVVMFVIIGSLLIAILLPMLTLGKDVGF